MKKSSIYLFLVLVFAVGVSFGQDAQGNLRGRVLDQSGEAAVGVNVLVQGPAQQGIRAGTSTDEGYFDIYSLPVGTYMVTLQHGAYQDVRITDVEVHLGTTTMVGEIQLNSTTHEAAEMVVHGGTSLIDPTSAATGSNLRIAEYAELPVDRNFRSLISMQAQANESYYGDEVNIGGATGLENSYFIDGINVTDPHRGAGSTNMPYNFIKEIQVKTGGYEAEYGHASGGIVNVVTHSGGNEFRTNVFGFLTSSGLTGDARRGLGEMRVEQFTSYDAGLSLGGPLVRDKLWFFGAYNGSRGDQDVDIAGVGLQPLEHKSHMFAGKLTWQASADTDVIITVSGDPSTAEVLDPTVDAYGAPVAVESADPLFGYKQMGGVNLSAQARHFWGTKAIIEASVAQMSRQEDLRGATEQGQAQPLFIDQRTGSTQGTWSGGYGDVREFNPSRLSARLHGTMFLRSHVLKTGFEYENAGLERYWALTAPGIIRQTDTGYSVLYFDGDKQVFNRVTTAFLQDSWLINDRLRLNAGLRWEKQHFGGAGQVAKTTEHQWAPRVGVIYQPGELGMSKVFGSFGRFYVQSPLYTLYDGYGVGTGETYELFYAPDVDPRVDPEGYDSRLDYGDAPTPLEPLSGEHIDEFVMGVARDVGNEVTVTMRGVHRTLREALALGFIPPFYFGNPGSGELDFLPKYKRDYSALELSISKVSSDKLNYSAAYVFSRNQGNYSGFYVSDVIADTPGNYFSLQASPQIPNSDGLLPNHRPHVFKLNGSYRADFGLTTGMFFTWQTGTPQNDFAELPIPFRRICLVERGSAGRTPSIWDLNLRFSYRMTGLIREGQQSRLILDVLHIGSPRKAVLVEQLHYFSADFDRNPSNPNANYGRPLYYQQPMTVRLGMEVDF